MKLFVNLTECNRRTVILTESQFQELLFEAATLQDIHDKYYQNIPYEEYHKVVSADPTYRQDKPDKMGKYGKWMLSLYQNGSLKDEDLYKASEYLSAFDKFKAKIDDKDITNYRALPELYNVVRPFIDNPDQSTSKQDEVKRIKEGAEKVYEDGKWLVIVPNTMESSCYYGKGTQWCTAATGSHNYFNRYNELGNLYINIDKENNRKYQFHFETESFMDETDEEIEKPVNLEIGMTDGLLQFYIKRYGATASFQLTTNFNMEEVAEVRGIEGFYIISEMPEFLYCFDKDSGQIIEYAQVENEYDESFIHGSINGRFVPVWSTDKYVYVNLYDVEYDGFVFNDGDGIEGFEFLSNTNHDNILVIFDNGESRMFSLSQMRYSNNVIPQSVNMHRLSSFAGTLSNKVYGEKFAVARNLETHLFALYSLETNSFITNFEYKQLIPGEPLTGTRLLVLYKQGSDGYYHNDVLMPDGKIISQEELARNPKIGESYGLIKY